MIDATDHLLVSELHLKDGAATVVVRTLDEALAYIENRTVGDRANRKSVIRRLQAARTTEEVQEADDAFRMWVEATGRLVLAIPRPTASNATLD